MNLGHQCLQNPKHVVIIIDSLQAFCNRLQHLECHPTPTVHIIVFFHVEIICLSKVSDERRVLRSGNVRDFLNCEGPWRIYGAIAPEPLDGQYAWREIQRRQ